MLTNGIGKHHVLLAQPQPIRALLEVLHFCTLPQLWIDSLDGRTLYGCSRLPLFGRRWLWHIFAPIHPLVVPAVNQRHGRLQHQRTNLAFLWLQPMQAPRTDRAIRRAIRALQNQPTFPFWVRTGRGSRATQHQTTARHANAFAARNAVIGLRMVWGVLAHATPPPQLVLNVFAPQVITIGTRVLHTGDAAPAWNQPPHPLAVGQDIADCIQRRVARFLYAFWRAS